MQKSRCAFLACFLAGVLSSGLFLSASGAGPKGTVYKIIVPKQGSLVGNPCYFCWVPESVTTYRSIIVHQHGCTRERDASQMMSDVQWITLAKKWQSPFIACSLTTGSDCSNWYTPSKGSDKTFLAALDTLARRTGHPEISTIPWAIWGHSGGSLWMTGMVNAYADRFAVGVAQSGSVEMSNTAGALKIPILHHNGGRDVIYNDVQFANGRKKNALWAHAINPKRLWVNGGRCATPTGLCWDTTMYGHAPWDLRMICIPWMDFVLASRLPDQAGTSLVKDMDTSNAWFGDTATRAIASAATFTGNKSAACWFPNERLAKMWKEYMATGTQKDSTPPPAPYNLTGTYNNGQIVLRWDADADLETGIKTFIIYRNGSLLQKMTWPNAPTTLFSAEKGFQRWDDGDQPNPAPAPNMQYTDNNLSATATYTYEVSTVNWSDVAGPKSGTLILKNGQVTDVKTYRTQTAASFAPVTTRCDLENGRLNLRPGIVDIYDIRGRLLKTVSLKDGGIMNVKMLLGPSAEKMVVVRNRGR